MRLMCKADGPCCRQYVLLTCCLFSLLFTHVHTAYAQVADHFFNRFSFRTNTIDWLATIPNVTVGFDLTPGPYNHTSLLAGIKWNWNTWHKMPDYYVFNVLDIRGEYRYYFRETQLPKDQKQKFLSAQRAHPHPWQARYMGAFVNYGSFSLKPGAIGRQGWQLGLGLSVGMEIPLYQYKTGAIDLDLGASAGISVSRYEKFSLNAANTAFISEGKPVFMVLPTIAELRAVLSWRKVSVKEKYWQKDPEKELFAQVREEVENDFEKTNKATFDASRSDSQIRKHAQSDSAYVADFKAWLTVNENDGYKKVDNSYISDAHKKSLKAQIKSIVRRIETSFLREIQAKRSTAKETKKGKETKNTKETDE